MYLYNYQKLAWFFFNIRYKNLGLFLDKNLKIVRYIRIFLYFIIR